MNKQELEHRIKIHQNAIAASEEIITTLKAQLAEAEKPKFRHGDFGYDKDGSACLALYAQGAETIRRASGTYLYEREISHPTNYKIANIAGNIFDLMKDWGKEWKASWRSKDSQSGRGTAITIDIDKSKTAIWFGSCGGSTWYAPEVIYEIWCKLGHALIELKRNKHGD